MLIARVGWVGGFFICNYEFISAIFMKLFWRQTKTRMLSHKFCKWIIWCRVVGVVTNIEWFQNFYTKIVNSFDEILILGIVKCEKR